MTGDHTAWWIPGDYDTQSMIIQSRSYLKYVHCCLNAVTSNASQTVFSPNRSANIIADENRWGCILICMKQLWLIIHVCI